MPSGVLSQGTEAGGMDRIGSEEGHGCQMT